MVRHRTELSQSWLKPLTFGIFMLLYAICCPNTSDGFGEMFYYPLYIDHSYSLVLLYTTGTWLWVYTISMLGA